MNATSPRDGDERLADLAYHAAARAYRAAGGDWEHGVSAALGELLDLLAAQQSQTERCTALAENSLEAIEQRGRLVARFADLLGPTTRTTNVARPAVVAEAVGHSVVELIGRYVAERRAAELPDALPIATLLTLTPFVGPDAAERLATSAVEERR